MTHKSRWIVVTVMLFASLSAAPAFADDVRATARETLIKGEELYEDGKYQEALPQIMTSWSLLRLPYTAVRAARAKEKLGRLAEAAKMYREAISAVPDHAWPKEQWKIQAQKQAQKDAHAELSALLPRIPVVTIEISGGNAAELDVTIDASLLSTDNPAEAQELDPGDHTVSVTTKRGQTLRETFKLAESERKVVAFNLGQLPSSAKPLVTELATNLAPPPAVISPPRGNVASHQPEESNAWAKFPTIGWIGAGVGAAGLAVGTSAYVVALAKRDRGSCDSDGYCNNHWYDNHREGYYNSRTVSTVGFVVGGVGVATAAVTWLVVKSRRQEALQVTMTLGPGTAGVRGEF